MILLPRWRRTAQIVQSPLVSAAPAALYVALVLPRLMEVWPAVSRPTLNGIALLLGSPAGATIAWIHFLAFDLFVGRWIYLDSSGRRISAWLIAPVLFLTLMLGPLGFLLYLILRSAAGSNSGSGNAVSALDLKETTEQSRAAATGTIFKRTEDQLRKLIHTAFEINRPLTILGAAMFLILLATLVGLLLDHRLITGVPAWLKPAKFAISVSVYSFTFVWLLSFIENHPRLVRLAANVTVVSFIVEMAAIITQALRGTTSHFNMTTPFNAVLWIMMGLFITFVWSMNLLLAAMLIRQRIPDRAFAWSLRFGVLISSVGMAVAFLMVRPTPGQISAFASQAPHTVGAHSVGVADGGPGLPVVGWSTVGGDLRAAHFVGLHALEIMPFFGWLLTRRRRSHDAFLAKNHRLALVWTGGFTYFAFVLLLAWQALRGQSVIHPDMRTIAAAIALASAAAVSTSITVVHALNTNRGARGRASRDIADQAERTEARLNA